jgi:hypothetical protein
MSKSDTPRTDIFYEGEGISDDQIFAEELERELTITCAEVAILKSKYVENYAETERLTSEMRLVTEQRDRLAEDVRGLLMAVTSDACKRGVLVQMTIDGFLAAHPEIQSLTTKDHE